MPKEGGKPIKQKLNLFGTLLKRALTPSFSFNIYQIK